VWSELHNAERVVRRIVDIKCETDLIDIEPHCSLDAAHRQMITPTEKVGVLPFTFPLHRFMPTCDEGVLRPR
jgi:hypothetical protein